MIRTFRRPDPPVVLIGGAPGTGKTTLAGALAPLLHAAVLDLDTATGPLTEVVSRLVGAADLSDPRIAALTRGPRYDTLFALAAENLAAGLPVVLVAPFTAERTVAGWAEAGRKLPGRAAPPLLVWLHLPADQLIVRIRQRAAARDADKNADFLAAVEPPQVAHLALDAALPVSDLVGQVVGELARRRLAIDGRILSRSVSAIDSKDLDPPG